MAQFGSRGISSRLQQKESIANRMDRVNQYAETAKQVLSELYQRYAHSSQDVQHHLVLDEERHQYLLITDGWLDDRRFYGIAIHLEVRSDGKLWVHDDNTDLVIVDDLLARGIPKQDMVLGWHAPSMREDTEFAIG